MREARIGVQAGGCVALVLASSDANPQNYQIPPQKV